MSDTPDYYIKIPPHVEVDTDEMDVYAWIKYEMDQMLREAMFIEHSMWVHQLIYGVPVGPTLNQLPGRGFEPKGIMSI